MQTLTHQLVPTWVLHVFLFFGFIDVFCFLTKSSKNLEKHPKKQKTKMQDPCRYKLVSLLQNVLLVKNEGFSAPPG